MRRVIGRGSPALLLGLLLGLTGTVGARDYYLAPDGNDEGPGNRENPWRSIARANAALGPGDRAVFLPGVYAGSISPARSGEPGKPVTYLAEKPGSVRIEGTLNPLYNEKVLIGIQDRRHLVVDGFANAGPGAKWLRLDRVHDSVFRNLRFDGTDFHNPIECRDSHRNRFRYPRLEWFLDLQNVHPFQSEYSLPVLPFPAAGSRPAHPLQNDSHKTRKNPAHTASVLPLRSVPSRFDRLPAAPWAFPHHNEDTNPSDPADSARP